jgi:hypothetical protein
MLNAVFKSAVGLLARGVHDVSFNVDFPTVIHAPDSRFLVSAEDKGRSTVGAALSQKADPSGRIAEGNQILAEKPHAKGCPVRLGDLLGEASWNPVSS